MSDITAKAYTDKDFVHYVTGEGDDTVVSEHPVPKAWLGTSFVPEGAKPATKAQLEKAGAGQVKTVVDDAKVDELSKQLAEANAKIADLEKAANPPKA